MNGRTASANPHAAKSYVPTFARQECNERLNAGEKNGVEKERVGLLTSDTLRQTLSAQKTYLRRLRSVLHKVIQIKIMKLVAARMLSVF